MSSELNTLIREVAAEHPRDDVRELARYVVAATPPGSLTDFYTAALIDTIRTILGNDRRNAFNGHDDQQNNSSSKNRSHKVEQRRSWWSTVLASRVHVGNTQWLRVGDCTAVDLKFCVEERRGQIAGFEKQILNFEALIHLMSEHGAQTVADLPEQEAWTS